MDENRKYIIEKLLEGHTTNHPSDAIYHAELLRLYKLSGDNEAYHFLVSLIMEVRKNWVNKLVEWQYKWQNRSKNNHHDTFETREKYIAPHVTGEWEFTKRARNYNKTRKPELFVWKYGIRE